MHGILTAEMHQIGGDQNLNILNTGLTENLHQNRGDQNQNIPNTGSTESSIESTETAEYVQLTCHQENNYDPTSDTM